MMRGDPGRVSPGRTGPNAGFEPSSRSPRGGRRAWNDDDGTPRRTRGGYYTDGDDPFGNYPFVGTAPSTPSR